MFIRFAAPTVLIVTCLATPAFAQDEDEALGVPADDAAVIVADEVEPDEDTVFDDTWLAVGIGGRFNTTYDGSDDYKFQVLPVLAGSIAGIGFRPRSAGFALELVDSDLSDRVSFSAGPSVSVRMNRTGGFKDPVVAAAGKLDTAIEVGGYSSVSIKDIVTGYDVLTFSGEMRFDVNGAHRGWTFEPGMSYRTPLSKGTVVSGSIGGRYASADFMDYYFSVNPTQAAASGLPLFQADKGWQKVGGSLAFGVDLDGNIDNGGFVVGVLGGYGRLLGDAKDSPYTSIRGSRDQWSIASGIGYIF